MPASSVAAIVGFYCLCSGGMLVLNKLAVHHTPAPAFVTIVQFAATAVGVALAHALGLLELDPLEWRKLRHFVVYILAFSGGTWANMKVLAAANVETVIVFRSCAPLCVSVLDFVFYGRALPSRRSCGAIGSIVPTVTLTLTLTPTVTLTVTLTRTLTLPLPQVRRHGPHRARRELIRERRSLARFANVDGDIRLAAALVRRPLTS